MIYLVSDIHGCYNTFLTLLKKIKFNSNDILICLGDAIDRGIYSFQVLDLFIKNNNFKLIKGNHEFFFELYCNNLLDGRLWYRFGGKDTIKHLKNISTDEMLKYYNYIHKLPLYIQINEYILLHSGFHADYPFIEKDGIILTKETVKKQFNTSPYDYMISSDIHYMPKKTFDKKIIVGHYPTLNFDEPKIHYGTNCIDIDCGATYKNGKLGCLRLDDMEEIYVNVKKEDVNSL